MGPAPSLRLQGSPAPGSGFNPSQNMGRFGWSGTRLESPFRGCALHGSLPWAWAAGPTGADWSASFALAFTFTAVARWLRRKAWTLSARCCGLPERPQPWGRITPLVCCGPTLLTLRRVLAAPPVRAPGHDEQAGIARQVIVASSCAIAWRGKRHPIAVDQIADEPLPVAPRRGNPSTWQNAV